LYYEDKQYVGTKNWTCYSYYLFRFSEIFLHFTEHAVIFDIPHILGYFRYAHDILIIYDSKIMDIRNVMDNFNGVHPTQIFTILEE
jgi:hypothetical protein